MAKGTHIYDLNRDQLLRLFTGSYSAAHNESFNKEVGDAVRDGRIETVVERIFNTINAPEPSPRGLKDRLVAVLERPPPPPLSCTRKILDLVPVGERVHIISTIVQMLYYRAFDPGGLKEPGNTQNFLVQLVAQHCSKEATIAVLSGLSVEERSKVGLWSLFNYNEGTYNLTKIFQEHPFEIDANLNVLIRGYENNTYPRKKMQTMFEKGVPLDVMVAKLEAEFEKMACSIYNVVKRSEGVDLPIETFMQFLRFKGVYGMPHELMRDFGEKQEEKWISEIFEEYARGDRMTQCEIKFLQNFTTQMEKFASRDFEKMVYVLPTIRSIKDSQYIQSLLDGYRQMGMDPTIIVIDQCEGEQLEKNKVFAKENGIRHLDRDQALEMADELGVRDKVDCGDGYTFGYAGGRNAAFFLAPKLMEGTECKWMQMGDDDMQMPLGILFYDLVTPSIGFDDGDPIKEVGPMVGRDTIHLPDPPTLFEVVHGYRHFVATWLRTDEVKEWVEPSLAGVRHPLLDPEWVKSHMLPAKPFAGEENDVVKKSTRRLWVPAMRHLAGVRIPKLDLIPDRPWVGMEGVVLHQHKVTWGSYVKVRDQYKLDAGYLSDQILNAHRGDRSSEVSMLLNKRYFTDNLAPLQAYMKDHPEEKESLEPLYAMYEKFHADIAQTVEFAKLVVADPHNVEAHKESLKITKGNPFAYSLYLAER